MRTTVFMAVLALACLSGASAGLFGGRSAYEMLADHLEKSTPSNNLADNIKQAASLLDQNPNASKELRELIGSFQSLVIDTAVPKSLCSRTNMFNLRRVAEAMRAGGNLDPKKITLSISRLNAILFAAIEQIHPICGKQLATEWNNFDWKSSFMSVKRGEDRVFKLRRVPYSFYEDLYMAKAIWAFHERLELGRALSKAIKSGERWAVAERQPTDPNEMRPYYTENKDVIGKQLKRFVYKPCEEFVKMDVAKSVLGAYHDLHMSSFIVVFGMDKYITNSGVMRPHLTLYDEYKSVQDWASSYEACQKILVTPVKKLSKRVAKARNFDNKP